MSRRCLAVAAWTAAGGFLAAYAPYALSGSYEPQIVGVMSRTNGVGGLVGGLLAATALAAAQGSWASAPAARRAGAAAQSLVTAILVAAFTWTNWFVALKWTQSYSQQQTILEKIEGKIRMLPRPLTVILEGAPPHFQGVVVFENHWGLSSALRLKTGDRNLSADVGLAGLVAEPEGLVERRDGKVVRSMPYDGLFLYNYADDKLMKIGR